MRYIKQLDSIRAIAVILVLIWHWLPKTSFLNTFRTGPFGVTIFFVLSGFLITKILLDNRNDAERLNNSKGTVLKSFYSRRILRIFPAYYLTVFLTLLLHRKLGLSFPFPEFLSSITYTSDFYVFELKKWPQLTPHFWSLSVEEQFYLIWPLIILFIPKKYLIHSMVVFVSIGIISQFFVQDPEFGYLLPHTCFDSLGMGAILSWIVVYKPHLLNKTYKLLSLLALVGLVMIILDLAGIKFFYEWRVIYSIIGAWVISYVIHFKNKQNKLSFLLDNKFLINIGKISYGIYLYHVLYFYLAWGRMAGFYYSHLSSIDSRIFPYLFFIINIWVLFFICWLSWRFIEKPFLGLKKYFKYPADDKIGILPVP